MRNPDWTRDELILAFELYLKKGNSPSIAEINSLSDLLRSLPIHNNIPDLERFRNANGVATKLSNIAAGDPSYHGKGLTRGNKIEKEIWAEIQSPGGKQNLIEAATAIRESSRTENSALNMPEEGEEECKEGKILYRKHRTRERDSKIVRKKKASVLSSTGKLECEVCKFTFKDKYGRHGEDYIECHHKLPLSSGAIKNTRLTDLALVCANCHRMLHRGKPWPTIEVLKDIVQS